MSLEHPSARSLMHRLERQHWTDYGTWDGPDVPLDAETPECEEALFREGLANLRRERPWLFRDGERAPSHDTRCFEADDAGNRGDWADPDTEVPW